jgi:hypothetical protein
VTGLFVIIVIIIIVSFKIVNLNIKFILDVFSRRSGSIVVIVKYPNNSRILSFRTK